MSAKLNTNISNVTQNNYTGSAGLFNAKDSLDSLVLHCSSTLSEVTGL